MSVKTAPSKQPISLMHLLQTTKLTLIKIGKFVSWIVAAKRLFNEVIIFSKIDVLLKI